MRERAIYIRAKAMQLSVIDRKGLIREAYRIAGITKGECRTIFLDWALSLPPHVPSREAITHLLEEYGGQSEHPMTEVLQEGLETPPTARRRGGRSARVGTAET